MAGGLVLSLLGLTSGPQAAPQAQPSPVVEELWNAARDGDAARVTKALDAGADVNAGNRYKATALFFAADKGHTNVIKLLLDRGADVNAQDTFYKFRPLGLALMNGHLDAALLLLQRGGLGAMQALSTGIQRKHTGLVDAALASDELTASNVRAAMALACSLASAICCGSMASAGRNVDAATRPLLSSFITNASSQMVGTVGMHVRE
mgnify:CR=1 FL=1